MILVLVSRLLYKKQVNIIKKNSELYKFLVKAVQDVKPKNLRQLYHYDKYLNSKSQFDNLNIDKQMTLLVVSKSIYNVILDGIHNKECYLELERRIKQAPPYTTGKNIFYVWLEKKLVKKFLDQNEPVIPIFSVKFNYVSPKGRNHYFRTCSFKISDMIRYLNLVEVREKYKKTAQYQRNLMSNSLRYDIMKRDGFRCVLCGKTANDGVKLHIDHIVPVSKGGKTTPENLRTLCSDCNLGKSNKYDRFGVN